MSFTIIPSVHVPLKIAFLIVNLQHNPVIRINAMSVFYNNGNFYLSHAEKSYKPAKIYYNTIIASKTSYFSWVTNDTPDKFLFQIK